MLRFAVVLLSLLTSVAAVLAQPVQWVGNSRMYLTGVGLLPTKGAYVEKYQSVSITTQTWPITTGQTVTAVVTTNNWITSQEYVFTFDYNTGNNSQWYLVLGPLAPGTDLQYYIRANGQSNSIVYDSNSGQNFGFYTRFTPNYRRETMLQWFETDYRTITQRLPEVVAAGYGALYLPPPTKSGGGQYSVGYNPFDRFDMGDRLNMGTVRTKYGTAQELHELIRVAKRLGLEVYCDVVYNHSDNRASTAMDRYPEMIPEDFHIKSSADTSNTEINFNNESPFSFGMLNHDLVGLADIAHEDNNNTRTGTFTLPSYATFNGSGKPSFIRHPRTAQYYPNGTPAAEDVRQFLKRWTWYLSTVYDFDGFRLDAVKHTPPSFFDAALGQPGSVSSNGEALPYAYSVKPNLYIFGENFTSNAYELREFTKTGMNMLDFPLKFNLDNLFNSSGFNNISSALANGYGLDGATGLPYEHGGLGRDLSISFVQSHDQGPPYSNNIAHAFTLTKAGRSKVYFDGNNIQAGNWANFPRPGRGDAIGDFGNTVTTLVDANLRYGRGDIVNRYGTDHLYVYERTVGGQGVMLVGLNNRGDQTELSALVQTGFAPGAVLVDLTGQKPNLTVDAQGRVTIVVPSNTDANSTNNARGYVVYVQPAPSATDARPVKLFDYVTGTEFLPATIATPAGTFGTPGSFFASTVNAPLVNLQVRTDASGFSAFAKLDSGLPLAGLTPAANTAEGLLDGYVPLTKQAAGQFSLGGVDLSGLAEGLHVLRVRAFLDTGSRPGVFREFRHFFYVRRGQTGVVVDGNLTDLGNPMVTQSRTPSSQSNRLDALYGANDDRYFYFGLAGNVDTSEGLTNGVSMFFDADPGAGTGVQNLNSLNDDSGPATRLLSNANVTAPTFFGAEYALGVLRRSQLSTSPEATTVGDPVLPTPVGAFAGFYKINPNALNWLERQRSAVAWLPRGSVNDPARGLEVAIPLEQLITTSVASGQQIGLLAYLGTTGESGSTLPSTNSLRGTLGGYGAANSYLTNQFLPVQTITNDPGYNPVSLTSSTRYTIRFATPQPNVRVVRRTLAQQPNGVFRDEVLITNRSAATLAGPITLRVTMDPDIRLVNQTGRSFRGGKPYVSFEGTLAGGGTMKVTLDYVVPAGKTYSPTFEVFSGRGIL